MPHARGGLSRELLSFRVGAQEFCIDIMAVREIRGWTPPPRCRMRRAMSAAWSTCAAQCCPSSIWPSAWGWAGPSRRRSTSSS